MKNKRLLKPQSPINLNKRNTLKWLGGSLLLASVGVKAQQNSDCVSNLSYRRAIPYLGKHQAGVITPEQKHASFIALNLTVSSATEVKQLLTTLTQRISFLTQPRELPQIENPHLPPAESGILGTQLQPDELTITVSLGDSFFDNRFGFESQKPKHLVPMKPFPNDRLDDNWCGGDLLLQLCANSQESVIYALRDILKYLSGQLHPVWKIDGFLPARDIDKKQTPINLFGFKDGSGNAPATDNTLMDNMVWITEKEKEPQWCIGGSYQAVRLIRFALEFWDRTPLEDQENNFGRHRSTGAPIGMKREMDDPDFKHDPHGDRVLFDSHMRRAEPRNPERYSAKLRRRSYSYSLGLTPSGQLDMGLIFISYQNNLKKGFIDTQKRLNGEPLERYIKPFGGGYYFTLAGIQKEGDILAQALFT
ncbi:ferrous iron transport peroxidase [Proteus hauseri ATCC 700826]|uniref:Deferrochelatase n=1 Tax=Proteus hauseri ATCC 700826 TaxID=1354271 RepID=A0AAJ3HTN6_PROHU|nr:iron uptake transporter deferrochelatase/peroxidase subunit [Proteus hauseri]OAT48636.1 ferrous iron transport peroxidase [Proteus hauseri ATCC 700826]